jgi:uncharacterized protein (DUF1697 family)
MKYTALLRGINVGGNSIIKMILLKECFEKAGFKNVVTFIQSGNVVFDSPEKNTAKLESKIEKLILKTFKIESKAMVRSLPQMKETVAKAPAAWKRKNNLRCYLAFTKAPITAKDVIKESVPKPGVDELKAGNGVVYMSTKLNALTKSGINKLIVKKIYKFMTIRNFNSTQKILALMEKK